MKNNKIFILVGIILAIFLATLDQMIVSTAMPQIVQDLNGISEISWVFTAYMLTSTITMVIYGKLADQMGHKRLYIIAILIFLFGSALSGLSQNMYQLIFFRALQGIGGGGVMILSIAMIADVFPPVQQAKYQGMIGGVSALSSIVGPLLGGWITDTWSWRWTFYVNVPLGIIALFVIIAALPDIRHKVKASSIDFLGAFTLCAGLVPFLLGLVWGGNDYAWNSWQIIGLFTASVVFLTTFIWAEHRAKNPVLAPDLFKNRIFVVSVMSSFISAMGLFGVILFVPVFAQGIIGVNATHSGLILTPMMISVIIAAIISGQIMSGTGKYKVLAISGMVIMAFGMYLFSKIDIHTSNNMLAIRMVMIGLGIGLTMPIFQLSVINAFPVTRTGEVTAGSQLFKGLGGTVGLAILGGLMNSQLADKLTEAVHEPFVVMMQKINPSKPFDVNFKTVQAMLNPESQRKVKMMISKAPEPMQSKILHSFEHFLNTIKVAFADALDHVFLVSALILAGGFIIVLFLPEIPLRKTNKTVGKELEEEVLPII